VLDHLAAPNQQMTRDWGFYSNVARGKRRAAARRLAAGLDLAFITEHASVARILRHIGMPAQRPEPLAHSPPLQEAPERQERVSCARGWRPSAKSECGVVPIGCSPGWAVSSLWWRSIRKARSASRRCLLGRRITPPPAPRAGSASRAKSASSVSSAIPPCKGHDLDIAVVAAGSPEHGHDENPVDAGGYRTQAAVQPSLTIHRLGCYPTDRRTHRIMRLASHGTSASARSR